MNEDSILKWVLETNFVPGVEIDWDALKSFLENPEFPDRTKKFKSELARAIIQQQITPKEFEQVTGLDQDSKEDVAEFLQTELWQPLYGDEPVDLSY